MGGLVTKDDRGCIVKKPDFITKDTGEKEEFSTGAVRDIQTGKPRYDLIPVCALKRVAELYARGAEKYGEHNFEKGMSFRRVFASLLRHIFQYFEGDREEDHLAAVAWGVFAIMLYENKIRSGKLPKDLDDLEGVENRWR